MNLASRMVHVKINSAPEEPPAIRALIRQISTLDVSLPYLYVEMEHQVAALDNLLNTIQHRAVKACKVAPLFSNEDVFRISLWVARPFLFI